MHSQGKSSSLSLRIKVATKFYCEEDGGDDDLDDYDADSDVDAGDDDDKDERKEMTKMKGKRCHRWHR